MNREEAISAYNKLSNFIGESIISVKNNGIVKVIETCFIAPINIMDIDKKTLESIMRSDDHIGLMLNEPYDVFLLVETDSIDSIQHLITSFEFYHDYRIV